MDFSRPRPRPLREPVLPMINVVFLLLIFFLMTARIEPAAPFDVTLPEANAQENADGDQTLYLSAAGELAMAGLTGDAVWQALGDLPKDRVIVIAADAEMRASQLAQVVARLGRLGLAQIEIAATQGGGTQ